VLNPKSKQSLQHAVGNIAAEKYRLLIKPGHHALHPNSLQYTKHLQYSQIHATWIWWHMHRARGAGFGHCRPILVLAIIGANMFPVV
jgi:hypothetical protein